MNVTKNNVSFDCMIYNGCIEDLWVDEYERYVTLGQWDDNGSEESGTALIAYTPELEITNAIKLPETETTLPINELVDRHPEIFEN